MNFDMSKKTTNKIAFEKFKGLIGIRKITRDGIVTLGIQAQKGATELIG